MEGARRWSGPHRGARSVHQRQPVGQRALRGDPRCLSEFGAEVTIKAGQAVVFTNGAVAHTITEGTGGKATSNACVDEPIGAGKSVVVTFTEPGNYQITCTIDSSMQTGSRIGREPDATEHMAVRSRGVTVAPAGGRDAGMEVSASASSYSQLHGDCNVRMTGPGVPSPLSHPRR